MASVSRQISAKKQVVAKDEFPYATIALLILCAAATLAFDATGSDLFVCFPREPFQLFGTPALLSLFAHEGFPHLITNSVFLFLAGLQLEPRIGRERLLALFLICGLAGIAGQAAVTATGTIGASGAIAGLAVAVVVLKPEDKRLDWFGAALVVWLAFGFLGFQAQKYGSPGLIGHGAHLGGAIAGFFFSQLPWLKPLSAQ